MVHFVPENGGRSSTAFTDEQGVFSVAKFDPQRTGVLVGTHKLVLEFQNTGADRDPLSLGSSLTPEQRALTKKYGKTSANPKTLDITKSMKNLTIDFD